MAEWIKSELLQILSGPLARQRIGRCEGIVELCQTDQRRKRGQTLAEEYA
jgi:hypothetical protein